VELGNQRFEQLNSETAFRNNLNGKNIHQIDALTVAQNLSVVLTEKLPPSNLTVFELML
jgi:ABC-type cobalamin/Fe3+-siderophores transport system ATPase subunit